MSSFWHRTIYCILPQPLITYTYVGVYATVAIRLNHTTLTRVRFFTFSATDMYTHPKLPYAQKGHIVKLACFKMNCLKKHKLVKVSVDEQFFMCRVVKNSR